MSLEPAPELVLASHELALAVEDLRQAWRLLAEAITAFELRQSRGRPVPFQALGHGRGGLAGTRAMKWGRLAERLLKLDLLNADLHDFLRNP